MKAHIVVLLAAVVALCLAASAPAQVPHLVSYQGRLTDAAGAPVPNGQYSMVFTIYNNFAGVWQETHASVAVDDGLFSVLLGSGDHTLFGDLDETEFVLNPPISMGIRVGNDPTLSPRTTFTSTPFAYIASTLEIPLEQTGNSWDVRPMISITNPCGNYQASAIEGIHSFSNHKGVLAPIWSGVYGSALNEVSYGDLGMDSIAVRGVSEKFWAGYFDGDFYASGRVSIGTEILDAQMEVGELLRVQGLNYSSAIYPDAGSGLEITYSPSNTLGIIQAYDRDASAFGNLALIGDSVGIGTTAPSERLHVNGKVYVGSMDATSGGYVVRWENNRLRRETSSARYKDNIQPLDEDFARILEVAPKSFVDRGSGEEHIGFIAEEFEQSGLEKLVIHDAEGQPDGIRYDLIPVYLLELVKELKAENEELRSRVAVLERR